MSGLRRWRGRVQAPAAPAFDRTLGLGETLCPECFRCPREAPGEADIPAGKAWIEIDRLLEKLLGISIVFGCVLIGVP
jgi:hypothetical protein